MYDLERVLQEYDGFFCGISVTYDGAAQCCDNGITKKPF